MKKHKIIELLTLITGILFCIMGSMSIACDCNPPCGSCRTCVNGNCVCLKDCCQNSHCGTCYKCVGCKCKPKCNPFACEYCGEDGQCYSYCDPCDCEECNGEGWCAVCGDDPNLACCDGDCYPWRCKSCVDGNIVDDCNAALCQTCDPNIGCVVCGGDPNLFCCEGECVPECNNYNGHNDWCTIDGNFCVGEYLPHLTWIVEPPDGCEVYPNKIITCSAHASDKDCKRCQGSGYKLVGDDVNAIWSDDTLRPVNEAFPGGNTGLSVQWRSPIVCGLNDVNVIITASFYNDPGNKYNESDSNSVTVIVKSDKSMGEEVIVTGSFSREDECNNTLTLIALGNAYCLLYNGQLVGNCPYNNGGNYIRYWMTADKMRFWGTYFKSEDNTNDGSIDDEGTINKYDSVERVYDCIYNLMQYVCIEHPTEKGGDDGTGSNCEVLLCQ